MDAMRLLKETSSPSIFDMDIKLSFLLLPNTVGLKLAGLWHSKDYFIFISVIMSQALCVHSLVSYLLLCYFSERG